MTKVINDHFEVGQKYRGMVNGAELTVEAVKEAGTYESPRGYTYTVESTQICFRDMKTGAIHEIGLETAKRLLLDLLEGGPDGTQKN